MPTPNKSPPDSSTMTAAKDLDLNKLDPELARRVSRQWAGRKKHLLDEMLEMSKGRNSCLGTAVENQLQQKQVFNLVD